MEMNKCLAIVELTLVNDNIREIFDGIKRICFHKEFKFKSWIVKVRIFIDR